jgi:hypothetical protein
LAAQQLATSAAEVIKVEPPEGDTTRQLGPMRNPDMGAFFLAVNRNKRSIVLDLKQESARKVLLKLASNADVFMHNYRPRRPSASACPTTCSRRSIRGWSMSAPTASGHGTVRRQAGL